MSKNDYGNRYPGSGTVAPGFGHSQPEPMPETPYLTGDELQAVYAAQLAPYITTK